MKKAVLTSVIMAICILALAQVPEFFNYQVVVRDGASNNPLTNQNVSFKMSILKGSTSGESQYSELHSVNTGTLGIVNLVIGNGTDKTGNITTIDWGADTYYLNVEIDKTGGSSYVDMGTTQLLSVPYALNAKTVSSYPETDPAFTAWDKSSGISITNGQITNWSGATSTFLTGITSGQVTTALGFTPYNSTNPSGYTSNTGTVTSVAMSTPVGLTIAGTPVTTSGTLALTLTSGYAIPTTDQLFPGFGISADKAANGNHTHDYSGVYAALVHDHSGIYEPVIAAGTTSQYWRGDKSWQALNTDAVTEGANLYYTDARARAAISLTTTGNSGAATYTSGVINIPDYTLSGLGGQSALNGTGLVRMTGTSVSYDNNTYLTSFTETDPNAVLITGDQTVSGNKTFTGITTVPTPVNATDVATKAYVDVLLEKIQQLQAELGARDVDGNSYKAVKIGNQVWMAENLKTTKYNDGNSIPLVTDATAWFNLTTPAYCWYNNDSATYKTTYGAWYNWYTVNSGKLCPQGWHVPTDAEWHALVLYLDPAATELNVESSIAGGKLKETGLTHWLIPNSGATNETGFTGLPGGLRDYFGAFVNLGYYGYWWSSSEANSSLAWSRALLYDAGSVEKGVGNYDKRDGFSVRCLRD